MTRSCFVDCPGNNCSDPLKVTIDAARADGQDWYRLTDHPAVCRGCGTRWDVMPLDLNQATLTTAYAEGE